MRIIIWVHCGCIFNCVGRNKLKDLRSRGVHKNAYMDFMATYTFASKEGVLETEGNGSVCIRCSNSASGIIGM